MKIFITLLTLALSPSLAFAIMCPTNFNQIDFGMSPEEVTQACGKPELQKESIKKNENIPQEWDYFIPQVVYMGGSQQYAQGTLKTSMTFDDRGKAVNISVNGIGVGASTICGGTSIQLGDSREKIQQSCGKPAFVQKQSPEDNPALPQDTKMIEYTYTSASPPVTLVFENGRLTDRR